METFTVDDLPSRAGQLVQQAEQGHFSLVTKQDGQPIFFTIPALIEQGVAVNRVDLAVRLFDQNWLTQGEAAQLAGLPLAEFFEACAIRRVSVVRYSADDVQMELKQHGLHHR